MSLGPNKSLLPPANVVKAQREHERKFYREQWEAFSKGMQRWAEERKRGTRS